MIRATFILMVTCMLGGCFDQPSVRLIAPRVVVEGGDRAVVVSTFHGYPELDWAKPATAEITAGPWYRPTSTAIAVQKVGFEQRRAWRMYLPKTPLPATLTIKVQYDGWLYRITADLTATDDRDPAGKTVLYKRGQETILPLRPAW